MALLVWRMFSFIVISLILGTGASSICSAIVNTANWPSTMLHILCSRVATAIHGMAGVTYDALPFSPMASPPPARPSVRSLLSPQPRQIGAASATTPTPTPVIVRALVPEGARFTAQETLSFGTRVPPYNLAGKRLRKLASTVRSMHAKLDECVTEHMRGTNPYCPCCLYSGSYVTAELPGLCGH